MHAKLLQSCLTLCDPMDSSPPGSPVHRILQVRILEWVAISFSKSQLSSSDETQTLERLYSIANPKLHPSLSHTLSIFRVLMVPHTITAGTQKVFPGTCLVVQWLEIHAPNEGGSSSIPSRGMRFHMPQLKDPACLN